jgi:hypothetical protein
VIDPFVWGPWAGMGKRPVPFSIKQRRRNRTKAILVTAAVVVIVLGALAGLHFEAPQL